MMIRQLESYLFNYSINNKAVKMEIKICFYLVPVVLITDDIGNRDIARQEGLSAFTRESN